MPEIDRWSDCISPEMRRVWPILEQVTRRLDGALIGGTALAIHLRHRKSYDLDFVTNMTFSGDRIARKLQELTGDAALRFGGTDQMHATVLGVEVQIFKDPLRGAQPGHVENIQDPIKVDGLRVASLPDLLASKLDVILYRPQLRDYIDLVAIDTAGPYTLEDGLLFHMHRYGTTPTSRDIDRIIDLLDEPGALRTDRVFGDQQDETLAYLCARVHDLRRYVHQSRISSTEVQRPAPSDRGEAGLL